MYTDTIADYLTRIRNASRAKHSKVVIPHSKLKEAITKVLIDRKFIEKYEVNNNDKFKELTIHLKDWITEPLTLKRVSKSGQRIYLKSNEMKKSRQGIGIYIVSTPKGVMTSTEAKKENVGGELICEVY